MNEEKVREKRGRRVCQSWGSDLRDIPCSISLISMGVSGWGVWQGTAFQSILHILTHAPS